MDRISNFVDITSADADVAKAYLNDARGNLEIALSTFFDGRAPIRSGVKGGGRGRGGGRGTVNNRGGRGGARGGSTQNYQNPSNNLNNNNIDSSSIPGCDCFNNHEGGSSDLFNNNTGGRRQRWIGNAQQHRGVGARVAVPSTKVKYVDSHCHLDGITNKLKTPTFGALRKQYFPDNFDGCVCIFCDPAALSPSFGTWQDLLNDESNLVYGAFGIPLLHQSFQQQAWGEMGLDYHHKHSTPEEQKSAFVRQIIRALELNKPLVIHTRDAESDMLAILKEHVPKEWEMHIHCFTDSPEFCEALLSHFTNCYIGITGVVTYANATQVQKVVRDVLPLNRLLLETDGPYMPPRAVDDIMNNNNNQGAGKNKGGAPSHSGLIPLIAQKFAQLKGVALDEVMQAARDNTRNLYGI
eukprot:GEZU01017718.1.p1 GENE.GEZU01017718.1~~GEZU01017718.1.p1  ORF type:complete len:410 (+),score=87.46 GEZU01017718.1:48-1277(+)